MHPGNRSPLPKRNRQRNEQPKQTHPPLHLLPPPRTLPGLRAHSDVVRPSHAAQEHPEQHGRPREDAVVLARPADAEPRDALRVHERCALKALRNAGVVRVANGGLHFERGDEAGEDRLDQLESVRDLRSIMWL